MHVRGLEPIERLHCSPLQQQQQWFCMHGAIGLNISDMLPWFILEKYNNDLLYWTTLFFKYMYFI